ncbi:MAG: fatty acid desaturase, partial [Pseudomonadota bacterium]
AAPPHRGEMTATSTNTPRAVTRLAAEWPTLALFAVAYGGVAGLLFLPVWAAIPGLALLIALHASLQHEAIHGHPFRAAWANAALAWPPLTLAIPYLRFYDTHLAHHTDARLTDPFDDPETNFLASADYARLPAWVRGVLRVNNTLIGRLLIGPVVGQVMFVMGDVRAAREGDRRVALGWLLHVPAVVVVIALVLLSPLPLWAYLVAAYLALSILKIRTFCEHQAHEQTGGRSVIIEDRGPLALIFLNNNLHVVHHLHPNVPWYELPAQFRARRDKYLKLNDDYRFSSYWEVFRRYFLRAKDPVAHPLWRR